MCAAAKLSRPSAKILAEIEVVWRSQGVDGSHAARPERQLLRQTHAGRIELCRAARPSRPDRRSADAFALPPPIRRICRPSLTEAFATLENLCEHLHLPVQSGSDTVLARMRRGYTRRGILRTGSQRLRERLSGRGAQHRYHRRLSRAKPTREFAETLELLRAAGV